MLKRKIYSRLREHFNNDTRALLVTGARQIGKTYAIRKVGRECFSHFVEINFLEQKEAVQLFEVSTNAADLLLRLSTLTGNSLVPGKTLIFFDEVQECKEIVTAIKFLVEEGSYRYVLSGSLLGVELNDIKSVPVGYMAVMEMYPLDFEEFVRAVGVANRVMEHLRGAFDGKTAVDDVVHSKMMELMGLYLLVGGMPAVVQTYIETNNLRRVYDIQQDVLNLYRKDIAKYDKASKFRISEVFDLIPSEINSQNKRFILKNLSEGARFRKYEETFLWLKEAGVALAVYNVEEPRTPLLLNKQHNLMKLFMNDVGLLTAMYGGDVQLRIMQRDININYGAIYENYVAQELYAHGWSGSEKGLYYFSNKKQGELDFVVECSSGVIPIEVKSGKNYSRHHALDGVMKNADYAIQQAYIFCQDNVKATSRVVYMPIYMLMFLQRPQPQDTEWKIDIDALRD